LSPFYFFAMSHNNFLKEKYNFLTPNLGQMDIRALALLSVLIVFSAVIGFKMAAFHPLVPIALLAAVALGIVTLVNTNLGLTILIFSMLLSPEIPIAQTIERAVTVRIEDFLIIAVFFAWFAKTSVRKELGLLRKTPLNKPILAYLAVSIFSTGLGIMSGNVSAKIGFFYILKYIEFFMIFFLFVNNLEDKRQIKTFIFCFLLVSFIIGVLTYAQIGRIDRPTAPFEGAHPEPNTLGGYLVLTLATALGILLYSSNTNVKLILLGLVCFNFYPLLMTLSRSSYLAFTLLYLILVIFSRKHRMILISLLVFAILFLPFFIPEKVKDRVLYTFSYGSDYTFGGGKIKLEKSAAARVETWQSAMDFLQKKPFFGFGVTGVPFMDSQYARLLAEIGIFGFLIFLWLIFAIIKSAWYIFNNSTDYFAQGLSLGFLGGFAGILLMGLAANVFVIVRISEPFWFLCACVMALLDIQPMKAAPGIKSMDHTDST